MYIVLKETQYSQLDDQRKINRENPFIIAFREIYRVWRAKRYNY